MIVPVRGTQEALIERCPTGVPGFDEITGGGFIRGTLVLLAGNPGTGKTTFSARFLYEGAVTYDEPGVYISFAESKNKFYKYMMKLGMDFTSLERQGNFKFIAMPTVVDKEVLGEIVTEMLEASNSLKAKRLVIDSITPMICLESPIEVRSMLHNALMNLVATKGITAILIADLPFGETKVGYGVEEFIVDAVILLRLKYGERGAPRRFMEIVKMRGVPLNNLVYEYSIIPGEGFKLHPPINLKEVKIDASNRLSTGIEGLDNILGGGLVRGLSTLVLGPSGVGKTMLGLHLAAEATLKGESTLFVTFEKPVDQLKYALKCMGYDVPQLINMGLKMVYVPLHELAPCDIREHLHRTHVVKGRGKDVVIVDGLSTLKRYLGEEVFIDLIEEIVNFYKTQNITSIFLMSEDYEDPNRTKYLDVMVDNVIAMKLKAFDEGSLRRSLRVIKAWMSGVDTREHELVLEANRPKIRLS